MRRSPRAISRNSTSASSPSSEEEADDFDFDVLDATKLIPEEILPVEIIGRMVLNRNPDNFFAETEQVAFHPGSMVPGIDFSEDPLLQGRLFSYLDTQLIRLGGPNFHELPVNRPRCPMHNFQRDGHMRMEVPKGRVAYEPNSLDPKGPRENPPSASPAIARRNPARRSGCGRRASPIITARRGFCSAPSRSRSSAMSSAPSPSSSARSRPSRSASACWAIS